MKFAVDRIIAEIKADHTDMSELVVIGVLNGSIPFMNDIIFKLPETITIDYVKVSSYGNSLESSGKVELLLDTKLDIQGKDVLIIDDIIDSGLTQRFLKDHFSKKKARTVKSCCLFYKNTNADYSGIRNINRILKLVK